MKLIVAIVQDEDAGRLVSALMDKGFGVTKLATTGGFLRAGNTTLISGVEDEKLDAALAVIEKICKSREQITASTTPMEMCIRDRQRTLSQDFYRPLDEICFEGFTTMEHLTPEQAEKGCFMPVKEGTEWGHTWEYMWMRARVVLPEAAQGERIVTVSYTHLDVYKRQIYFGSSKPRAESSSL